ncbi:hypothetical protein [Rhodanobacter sp. C01]|uniref:hypothetical protein n=1 Tax=Rhodanobacter sp. C01 TaxID=1945856 RepID=UPI001115A4F9|nr:hypothetical protein [Rhodanobacter sp. C01]
MENSAGSIDSEKAHFDKTAENDMRSLTGATEAADRLFTLARAAGVGAVMVSVRDTGMSSLVNASNKAMSEAQPSTLAVKFQPGKLRRFSTYRQSIMEPDCRHEWD